MRHYHIYLLKEDVAFDYFGKEFLIFNLFLEKLKETNVDRIELLEKQIEYITKPLSVIEINHYIEKALLVEAQFKVKTTQFIYNCNRSRVQSFAKLEISDRYMKLSSEGSYDAETACFETLRKYHPCFFAMDFENKHFGWLNPIKQKRYV